MEGFVTDHQPEDVFLRCNGCRVEVHEDAYPRHVEHCGGFYAPVMSDEEIIARVVKPKVAEKAAKGVKRPAEPDEPERPDLDLYFNEFSDIGPEVTVEERIKICRCYASYLSSLLPPKTRKTAKKNK